MVPAQWGEPAPVKKPRRDFLDNEHRTATEIELYLSHAYPMNNSDGVLQWWAVSICPICMIDTTLTYLPLIV